MNTTNASTQSKNGSPLSASDIATCIAHVKAIAAVLEPHAIKLTTDERRAQPKYRKEGNTVVPILARLAAAAGLSGSGIDVDQMQQQVALAAALQPLHTQVKTLCDSIADTVLGSRGKAWYSATTLHAALRRLAKHDSVLRRDMEAIARAFTVRRTKGAKSEASANAAPAPPTATAATSAARA